MRVNFFRLKAVYRHRVTEFLEKKISSYDILYDSRAQRLKCTNLKSWIFCSMSTPLHPFFVLPVHCSASFLNIAYFQMKFGWIKLFRRWAIFYSAIDGWRKKSPKYSAYKLLLNESIHIHTLFVQTMTVILTTWCLVLFPRSLRAENFYSFRLKLWNVVFCICFANYVRDTNNFAFGLVWTSFIRLDLYSFSREKELKRATIPMKEYGK